MLAIAKLSVAKGEEIVQNQLTDRCHLGPITKYRISYAINQIKSGCLSGAYKRVITQINAFTKYVLTKLFIDVSIPAILSDSALHALSFSVECVFGLRMPSNNRWIIDFRMRISRRDKLQPNKIAWQSRNGAFHSGYIHSFTTSSANKMIKLNWKTYCIGQH